MRQRFHITHIPRQRHFLAVFFISYFWGVFGVDRMYLGKWGTGILKLITAGGFGLWIIIDLFLIMNGSMLDKQGREMLQHAEYRSFAYKTTLIFAAVTALIVILLGAVLIIGVEQFITNTQNGSGIPGLDSLNGLQSGGVTPEQMSELGL